MTSQIRVRTYLAEIFFNECQFLRFLETIEKMASNSNITSEE